jgi:nucleotide-binding universal stress UspA family protein
MADTRLHVLYVQPPMRVYGEIEIYVGEAIPRRAVELDCAWIVMGTHGRGRIGSAVIGSVAQKVIHHSSVPVTLVR